MEKRFVLILIMSFYLFTFGKAFGSPSPPVKNNELQPVITQPFDFGICIKFFKMDSQSFFI